MQLKGRGQIQSNLYCIISETYESVAFKIVALHPHTFVVVLFSSSICIYCHKLIYGTILFRFWDALQHAGYMNSDLENLKSINRLLYTEEL